MARLDGVVDVAGGVLPAAVVVLVLHQPLNSANGELRIFKASPKEYEQLASFRVAEDGTWAPPVLLKDGLLIKDHKHLTKWALKP